MAGVTKPYYYAVYYFNIYDTEKNELIKKFDRDGPLKMHMIFDYKVDLSNQENFFFATWNYSEAQVVKANMLTGKTDVVGTNKSVTTMPQFYYLTETCSQVYLGFYAYTQNKYMTKAYTYKVNESPQIEIDAAKGHKCMYPYYSNSYIDGNHLLSVYNNDRNLLEAN